MRHFGGTESPSPQSLTVTPIGYARTLLTSKREAARQPQAAHGTQGRIELLPNCNFEHALLDLATWDFIWVLFWFDRNEHWRPKVLPPRSVDGRKGVFATRSPHRPNPIGLSALRLERVEGLTLHVGELDLLDGTPVLDIKPYVSYTDAIASASSGWLERPRDPVLPYAVQWESTPADQAAWIERRTALPLRRQATATLELGPQPHPYRRIRKQGEEFVLAVREWRIRFGVDGRKVDVRRVTSGFRRAQLQGARLDAASRSLHAEFHSQWPQDP